MRLVVCLLVFLVLTSEDPRAFAGRWQTVMAYAYPFVDRIRSLPVSAWDLAMGAVGLGALLNPATWRGRARLLDVALLVSLAGIGAATAWGAVRGGDVRQSFFQLTQLLQMFLATHVFIAVFRNGRDYLWLGRAILAAALYRALACVLFYILFLSNESIPYPESITGHDDSGLWTIALLGLASWLLTAPRLKAILIVIPLSVILLSAMHFNNRRLAWVALAGGLLMVYMGMPLRRLSPRVKLWALAIVPLLVAYVAVGWRSSSRIFAPVAMIRSAVVGGDDSSISRDIENTGLVLTLRLNLAAGAGFGHEYIEVSPAFSQGMQSIFEQYRYIPHNSLLGLVAFSGVLLFPVIWTALPIGAFLAARASLFAHSPRDRLLAMVAFATPFVYSVVAYGDMGLQSRVANVLLAAGFAAASRLAVQTGAWGQRRRRAPAGQRLPAWRHAGPSPGSAERPDDAQETVDRATR